MASSSETPAGPTPQVVAAMTPKLPEFYTQNSKLRFTRAESEFATCHPVITAARNKFCHVVKALDQATALRVEDVLEHPDELLPYTKLKNRLLEIFSLTDCEKASRVLDYLELGDSSALKMTEDIERWLGQEGHRLLVKEIVFRRLQEAVRMVLENDDTSDIHLLAKKADQLRAVSHASVAAFRPSSVGRTPSASPPYPAKKTDKPCYFHKRFGTEARNCRPPCPHEIKENTNAVRL